MTYAYERFLNYVALPTTSDESSENSPSTEGQLSLAKLLADELLSLGLSDARVDSFGYVYATLPKNTEGDIPSIGLIAHLDTAPDAPGKNIKAKIVEYDGKDILLDNANRSDAKHYDSKSFSARYASRGD